MAVIELRREDSRQEASAIKAPSSRQDRVVVGYPSKAALEEMLQFCGFEFRYFDWAAAGIANWDHLEDYRDSIRVSLLAKRATND
jgi:hypothetical protein